MIHNYTSNISREQFELIRETTRLRTGNLYEVFCVVLYLLTTGCQWRNLPSDFPNWKTGYSYYQIWRKVDEKVTNILCDGGYTGKSFAQSIKEMIDYSVEIIKRSELHKFVILSKRWIVERMFIWLENYRRLWKNCERTLENSKQSCLLAGVAILLKRF